MLTRMGATNEVVHLSANELAKSSSRVLLIALRIDENGQDSDEMNLATPVLCDVTASPGKNAVKSDEIRFSLRHDGGLSGHTSSSGQTMDLKAKLALIRQTVARINLANSNSYTDDERDDPSACTLNPTIPETQQTGRTSKDKSQEDTATSAGVEKAETRNDDLSVPKDHLRSHASSLLENARRLLEEPNDSSFQQAMESKLRENPSFLHDQVKSILNESRAIRDSSRSRRQQNLEVEADPDSLPFCPIRDHARRVLESAVSIRSIQTHTNLKSRDESLGKETISQKDDLDEIPPDIIRTHARRLLEDLGINFIEQADEVCEQPPSQALLSLSPDLKGNVGPQFKCMLQLLKLMLELLSALMVAAIQALVKVFTLCSVAKVTSKEFTQMLALNPCKL